MRYFCSAALENIMMQRMITKKVLFLVLKKAVAIITSAAIIVISICFSFLVADVLMVKSLWFRHCGSYFFDAFLIRIILVPSPCR